MIQIPALAVDDSDGAASAVFANVA